MITDDLRVHDAASAEYALAHIETRSGVTVYSLREPIEKLLSRLREGCQMCGRLRDVVSVPREREYAEPISLCRTCLRSLTDLIVSREIERRGEEWIDSRVRHSSGLVYFVQRGPLVKIGTTASRATLAQRVAAAKGDLLAIESGGRDREQELHRRFAYCRRRGEWFKMTRALRAYIDAIGSKT